MMQHAHKAVGIGIQSASLCRASSGRPCRRVGTAAAAAAAAANSRPMGVGPTAALAPCSSPTFHQTRRRFPPTPAAAAGGDAAGGATPAPVPAASPTAAPQVAATLATGVMNRVLYRIALVPMGSHVFALAQFQNIGYILIYFSLLAARYRQGKVTQAMLNVPKGRFVLTGGCEALAQLLMMAGAAKLPGPLLPLLMQTGLLWNVLFSALLLGKRPTALQLLGVFLVISGVCLASLPGPSGAAAAGAGAAAALLQAGELKYVALCVVSFAFPALSVIVKEQIFRDAKQQLGGRDLDVLVVNAFGSTAQAVFVLLLLPFITAVRGLPLSALPSVLSDGAAALAAEPAFPLAYVAFNIAFNISALALVRSTSALAASLTLSAVVPLSVAAFTLPLPLLPQTALAPSFWAGCVLLMAGLWAYNWRQGGGGKAVAGGGGSGGKAGGG